MAKESSLALRTCDWIAKYAVYATIFLMPLFFLPWTSEVLEFNKQALLILLGIVALSAWMLKVLISGKLEISFSKTHLVVGALFLAALLSTLFSVNRYGSFWGWPQITSESLLSLIGLLVFYFLISNTFSKKEIFNSVVVAFVSALIAEVVGLLQLFGVFIIPFPFAQSVSFNTVGSVGSLGFMAVILLPLTIVMLIVSKKWWKVLFAFQLVLSAIILFSINYSIIWWAVLASCAVLMIFGAIKRNVFDGRWMALPMFFFAVSLFFILLNPQIPWISQRANEIFLSQGASANISLKVIKEKPVFGSGLGTFAYDFLKFKDPSFSQSTLWNATFSQASSKVLNDSASMGVLGLIVLLAFIIVPSFYGIKFLISEKVSKDDNSPKGDKTGAKMYWALSMGILASVITQFIMYFLYNTDLTLGLLNFVLLAALVNLVSPDKRQYELKPSSLTTLVVTFMFTLMFIFGIGLLILDGQRYIAEINYFQGLSAMQSQNADVGTRDIESAASLNPNSDLYFVQLSQVYLFNLQTELRNTNATPTDTEKTKIQTLIANAVNAAKIATDLNPNNSADWANRGYIYQSLNGIIGDSSTWSLSSYDSALKLNPNDPYVLTQEGAVHYISASILGSDKTDQKNQLLSQAKSELQQALSLNPNYSNGLYSLGLVDDAMGNTADAIKEFTLLQQLNPKDTTIPKILSNLNAGLPALQQQAPPAPTPPPTSGSSSDNTVSNPLSSKTSSSSSSKTTK